MQHRINVKYDTWQKETQQRFGTLLSEEIKTAKSELHACKERLESIYLEGPTKDVISGVEYILKCKSTVSHRVQSVEQLEQSEKLLTKQRYVFPRDWIAVSNVVGALVDFKFILQKRSQQMDLQLPSLQLKIRFVRSFVQLGSGLLLVCLLACLLVCLFVCLCICICMSELYEQQRN